MLRQRLRLPLFWLRVQAKRTSTMGKFRLSNDQFVKLMAFVGAFCAVIAQAESVPDLARYAAAAIAAGCSAVLALTRSPGQPRPPSGETRG